MFDPKSAEAYKSIRAPESLKTRVLQADPKKRIRFSPAFSTLVAAGLAAVFFSISWFSATPPGVTVGGLQVAEQAVVLPTESVPMMARAEATTSQTVVFDEEVTLLTADGSLTDPEYMPLSLPCELEADTPFLWHVRTPEETFYLTAEADGEPLKLCLTYEETENQWMICRMAAE